MMIMMMMIIIINKRFVFEWTGLIIIKVYHGMVLP